MRFEENRTVYCSSKQFKSHAVAAKWVKAAMDHFGIRADELLGKPYEVAQQPKGATIF